MLTLFTVGYNAWKADQRMQRMGHSLQDAGVTLLVAWTLVFDENRNFPGKIRGIVHRTS